MIASLVAAHGGVTRDQVRDMILRLCMIGDERDHFDGDEAGEAGNHLIDFYTALFVDSESETLLEAEAAEAVVIENFAKAYRSGVNRACRARKLGREVTLEDAQEAFMPNDYFSPCRVMSMELATKLGIAMGDYEAQKAARFHDYYAANR